MNTRRILAIGKLLLLFGTPLAFIVGLFSCGVYCGATHRVGITTFERDWLGMNVQVPAEPEPKPETWADAIGLAKTQAAKKPEAGATDSTPEQPKPDAPSNTPSPDAEPSPPPKPQAPAPVEDPPADPPPPDAEPEPIVPTPDTRADPLEGDLATALRMPVTVRIKVLVDDELIAARADWIDDVQRTVAQASHTYEKQFGITLELVGVGRWPVATAGLDSTQLLHDLRTRPRESSDVLVGFTGRPWDDRTAGKADRPELDGPYNGGYGVVYAMPGHRQSHLRTLLHELGHVFGAIDVTDPSDAAFVAKSFMSYAAARESEAPWIDADNRERILRRKDLPFIPEDDEE